MRFNRLVVSHFKGIKSVDIAFAPKGITLIEGPNEIGKSSLIHALITLFEMPVSKTRATLGHLIPNDSSGTPEILLEAQSGEYRFVYRKKYIADKTVELTLVEPDARQFKGEQAQEQFNRILDETLDRSLWRALMLQQGSAVGLPEVKDQQALLTALDNAVASSGVTADMGSLYAKISEEYGKYYHAGHSGELQNLRELRDAVERAEAKWKEAENDLRELSGKINLLKQLRGLLNELNKRETTELQMKSDSERKLKEIEICEKTLDAEKKKLEIARQKRAGAERGLEPRKELIEAEAKADESLKHILADLESAKDFEKDMARVTNEKEEIWKGLDKNRKQSGALAELRRADYEHLRDRFDLEQMRERKQRIDESTARVGKANAEIAGNKMTEAALKKIHEVQKNVELARIRRDAAVPRVLLDAIAPCDIVLDGDAVRLAANEQRTISVSGAVNLGIPGVLSVTVTAGDGGDGIEDKLMEAEECLRTLLAKYGIETADDAPLMLEKRREAVRIIDDHKRVFKENLRDLAYSGDAGGLVERILGLEEKTADYELARSDEIAIPPSLDLAEMERVNAGKVHDEAVNAYNEAKSALKSAETGQRTATEEVSRLEAEKVVTERELESLRQSLEKLRKTETDEMLDKAFADADATYSDANRAVAVIETELKELNPEQVRQRLETLDKALTKTASEKADVRVKLAGLVVEVESLGGKGPNERAIEASADLERHKARLNAELRKAGAAKLLYDVITETRGCSQRAYLIPLKNQIEELARSVYSTNVGVELTPELKIASRIMHGQSVAFNHLSGGACEQFSLIHRAACSLTVSKDGGVPLILDDALGYSDAGRLIGMNEVLSRAAQKCQIIILTCMPNRYGYIEPAVRINMEEILAK